MKRQVQHKKQPNQVIGKNTSLTACVQLSPLPGCMESGLSLQIFSLSEFPNTNVHSTRRDTWNNIYFILSVPSIVLRRWWEYYWSNVANQICGQIEMNEKVKPLFYWGGECKNGITPPTPKWFQTLIITNNILIHSTTRCISKRDVHFQPYPGTVASLRGMYTLEGRSLSTIP